MSIYMCNEYRLKKELEFYNKELLIQDAVVMKMHAENGCTHDIKKAAEVLDETRSIIPDCRSRLSSAREKLREFLVRPTKP